MKTAKLLFLLAVTLVNGGCSLAILSHDIAATDLTTVGAGAVRADVEKLLGEPVASAPQGARQVVTYRYDRGHIAENFDADSIRFYLGLYGPFWEPLLTPIALGVHVSRYNDQRAEIAVTYDADGCIVAVEDRGLVGATGDGTDGGEDGGEGGGEGRGADRAPSAAAAVSPGAPLSGDGGCLKSGAIHP